jgi:long-subunit fatty acid transport protein
VNISPSENLNIGIKYEMATKLELQNETVKDLTIGYTATGVPITYFPNGEKFRSDMPAMLAVGIDIRPVSSLKVSLGSNYFFDKSADYGHKMDLDNNSSTPDTYVPNSDIIDDNGFSIQGGLEYIISDNFLVSGGYVFANKGVNSKYQSELTYGLGTQTFGAGGAFSISDNFQINFGASYTLYKKDEKTINHVFAPLNIVIPATETFNKTAIVFGVGIDFSF